jgi:hypothetical protein
MPFGRIVRLGRFTMVKQRRNTTWDWKQYVTPRIYRKSWGVTVTMCLVSLIWGNDAGLNWPKCSSDYSVCDLLVQGSCFQTRERQVCPKCPCQKLVTGSTVFDKRTKPLRPGLRRLGTARTSNGICKNMAKTQLLVLMSR